jgi:hypothetical protein
MTCAVPRIRLLVRLLSTFTLVTISVFLLTGICMIAGVASLLFGLSYVTTPRPAPAPYPGAQVTEEWTGGSCCDGRIRSYTVSQSLATVEQWYVQQMVQFCEPGWQFMWDGSERVADCSIPRLWGGQSFDVRLSKLPGTGTDVWSEEMWTSP